MSKSTSAITTAVCCTKAVAQCTLGQYTASSTSLAEALKEHAFYKDFDADSDED